MINLPDNIIKIGATIIIDIYSVNFRTQFRCFLIPQMALKDNSILVKTFITDQNKTKILTPAITPPLVLFKNDFEKPINTFRISNYKLNGKKIFKR